MLRWSVLADSTGLLTWWKDGGTMIPQWWWILIAVWIGGAFALNLLPGWGLGAVEELRRVTWLIGGVFSVIAITLFLGKIGGTESRFTITSAMLISGPLILVFRYISKNLLIRWGGWGLPTMVYGGSETARLAIRALHEDQGLGFVPVGVFENGKMPGVDTVEGLPVLGTLNQSSTTAPAAVFALSDSTRHELVHMLEGPLASYHRVIIIPDLIEAPSLWVQPRDVGGVLGLEVSANLRSPRPPAAARRRLDGRRERRGVAGGEVVAREELKALFKDMDTDGDNELSLAELRHLGIRLGHEFTDEALREEWEKNFKLKNDPRITRVGKWLRRMSLDELPQLYNVLIGDMSLVGPRPLPMYHHAQLPKHIRNLRKRVRPGITGLWQVSGRSESGNEGMIRLRRLRMCLGSCA